MDEKQIRFKIARAGLHRFEEPCISGDGGSGTIFFSGCSMSCLFCQNYEISQLKKGLTVDADDFGYLVDKLLDEGAENINLVTPSAYTAALAELLPQLKKKRDFTVVWNSSGFESVAALKKLEGVVDVFLPDFKYSDDKMAFEYSGAKKYFDTAYSAITEMRRQQPEDIFDERGMMRKGVIVRHLVLPAALENTRGVVEALAKIDATIIVSLMGQYFPANKAHTHPVLSRRIRQDEYDRAVEYFFEAGLENGFSQELDSAIEEYVPEFDLDLLSKMLQDRS